MAFAPINDGGLAGLFEGLTPFGTSIPSGILTDEQEAKLRQQSLISGLIGTAATYAATPKNLGAGSPLPYLGKAFIGGMGASQDTINAALNNAYRRQLLAQRDDGFSNINPLDVTPESLKLYIEGGKKDPSVLRRVPPVEKEPSLPTSAQEFERAKNDPQYMKFLREKWDAENKALKANLQAEESAYNFATTRPTVNPPKFATMQDVSDTAKATGKTTDQVIKDLKSKGIQVRTQ